jgi:HPt (histidine-containing phosphotransfer) domain-containing protein
MRKAIAAGDADALRKAAHALKGSSANLGAQQVSAVSAELEKLGRSGTVQGAEALFARLESEFARALAALASRGPA